MTTVSNSRSRVTTFVFLVAPLVLLAINCAEVAEPSGESEDLTAEDPKAPVIETVTADGVRAMIDAAKGTVIVANFWATWCPPCVKEMPELVKFYNAHHGKGVTFLSLSVDHPSTIDSAVKPFVDEHAVPFPVYVVDEQDPSAIAEETGLEMTGAVPTTWVIDADGNPVRAWVEETTAAELEEAVRPLIPTAARVSSAFEGSEAK
jgi:peroxiredoxin